ncbi:MAG: glycosyltransferase family 8 protein [Eubacteriales bacterium]|nr:glycosyltransferase family 8 protein [Eubacteriales bacterium]
MNILVTLNANYIKPLKVMLKSLFMNNENECFDIYLMHTSLKEEELESLNAYIARHGGRLFIVKMDDGCFQDAPVLLHYTKEMYFRLLAYKFLPEGLDRILYLDPDILVLNPVRKLYETELGDCLYGAAYHDKIPVKEINRLRLFPYEIDAYYNSGVLLMNLGQLRAQVDAQEIYRFVEENRMKLIMPDQDILNALYAKQIKSIDEKLYNYDARYYGYYKLTSNGACDMEYIINNTVILHFCGKRKPWGNQYSGKFFSLYKHYEKCAARMEFHRSPAFDSRWVHHPVQSVHNP